MSPDWSLIAWGDRRPRLAMAEHVRSFDHEDRRNWDDRELARQVAEACYPGRVFDALAPTPLTQVGRPVSGEVWVGVFGDVTVLVMSSEPADTRGWDGLPGSGSATVRARFGSDGGDGSLALDYHDDRTGEHQHHEIHSEVLWRRADEGDTGQLRLFEQAMRWVFGLVLAGDRVPDDLPPVKTYLYGFRLLPLREDGTPDRRADLVSGEGLPVVSLPSPDRLAEQLLAAGKAGHLDVVHAGSDRVAVSTGGGDVLDLHLLPDGTALLAGRNDDDVTTYFRQSAAYFEEPETDLLAGAPAWWDDVLEEYHDGLRGPAVEERAEWVTFVFGWDGRLWTKAVGAPGGEWARSLFEDL